MPSSFHREKRPDFSPNIFTWTMDILLFSITIFHVAACFMRYIFLSLPIWKTPELQSLTFGQWARETRWDNFLARLLYLDVAWDGFIYDILVPLYSGMCTAPAEAILDHPAEEFLGELPVLIFFFLYLNRLFRLQLAWLRHTTLHCVERSPGRG